MATILPFRHAPNPIPALEITRSVSVLLSLCILRRNLLLSHFLRIITCYPHYWRERIVWVPPPPPTTTTLIHRCHCCWIDISNRPPREPWSVPGADPDFRQAMPCDCLRSTACDPVRQRAAPSVLGCWRPTIGFARGGGGDAGCWRCCLLPKTFGNPKKIA